MTKKDIGKKYIDIAKIIRENNPGVLNKLPGFVIRGIALIIRQNKMNYVLNKYADDYGFDFLEKIIEEFNLKIVIEGKENLPENGRCFFVANHPFGVIDGLMITHTVYEKYGEVKAIANDAFEFLPQLRPLVTKVNVYGRTPKEYVKALNETYNSDVPITHFPSGEVSRRYNGKVQDAAWQKSFIAKTISSKRDIVPFYFYGKNSGLFYTINMLRQLLGIKVNIELMLLPHEMFRKRNKTIKIKIGEPISYKSFDESLSHKEWAQKLRLHVYELGENNSIDKF
ncbi:1-acyl-sn-glycerol-3-phosphate acyltransferase [Bacteroidota bacterium]